MTCQEQLLIIVFLPLFLIAIYLAGAPMLLILCVIADVVGIMREKAKKNIEEFFT